MRKLRIALIMMMIGVVIAMTACSMGGGGGSGGGGSGGGSAAPAGSPYVMKVFLSGAAGSRAVVRAVASSVTGTVGSNPIFGVPLDYTVKISGAGGTETINARSGQSVQFTGLVAGSWTLEVSGTLMSVSVVTGSTPVTISAGETTAAEVPLEYDQARLAGLQEFNDVTTPVFRIGPGDSWPTLTSGNNVVEVTGTIVVRGAVTGTAPAVALNTAGQRVVLIGSGTISHTGTGSLFDIQSGQLIIRGPTLQGNNAANDALVRVPSGNLTLRDGVITGNINTSNGGGVLVETSGTFTMSGGTISGNTCSGDGGGVYVNTISGGSFTMNGGTISGNTSNSNGGGVFVDTSGTFAKSGNSSIENNTATGGNQVYVTSGVIRSRDANAGPGVTIDVPSDLSTPQNSGPWI
ncbi:hypothetical protein FACS1894161_3650 [Spirochaetia bacterium]|nr:hypothetical protein FACS1894161_3650 [Spirochaetia bacterium]